MITNIFFKIIVFQQDNLDNVISASIGHKTPEKLHQVLASYNAPHNYLIGAFLEQELVAVIGVKINKDIVIIRHISVLPAHRGRNIGRKLIEHAVEYFKANQLQAETDNEAIGFYKSLGFACEEFQGKFCTRYLCSLIIN